MGGMARRATAIKDYRRRHPDVAVLMLETGNALKQSDNLDDPASRWVVEALNEIGVQAVNTTAGDFRRLDRLAALDRLPKDLRTAYVSTNLAAPAGSRFSPKPFMVEALKPEAGGEAVRIGVLALSPPEAGRGASVEEALRRYVREVERESDLVVLLARLAERDRTLQAGEYRFARPASVLEVYERIARGDVYYVELVVPEGKNMFDIGMLAERLGLFPAAKFVEAARDPSPIRDLDPQAPTLEGYLFPDTYRFPRGASAATVALTMLARFRHVLSSRLPQDLQQSPARLHEAVTLASMVEKETADADERPLIAGVFARRLKARMPLQCDPTVVYAARLDHEPAGPITQSELALASPYNTYRKAGLPPGPICSAGESSIRAALDPAAGDALYFVSNNHGGHVFASTLAAHQRNVARYRRELAELRQTEAGPDPESSTRAAGQSGTARSMAEPAGKGTADGPPAESAAANPVKPATRQNPARRKGRERGARQKKRHQSHQNQE